MKMVGCPRQTQRKASCVVLIFQNKPKTCLLHCHGFYISETLKEALTDISFNKEYIFIYTSISVPGFFFSFISVCFFFVRHSKQPMKKEKKRYHGNYLASISIMSTVSKLN